MLTKDSGSSTPSSDYQVNVRAFATRLVTGILFANLIVLCLVILILSQFRHEREERVKIQAQNYSYILEHSIAGILHKIDIVLLTLKEETERQNNGGGINKSSINSIFSRQHLHVPEVENLLMANSDGDVIFGSGPFNGTSFNVADRDYFTKFKYSPKDELYISKPIQGRSSNKWLIIVARRINHPDGSFLGVVLGGLPLDNFSKLFTSLDIGPRGGISLRDKEMGIIARYPVHKDIGSIMGNKTLSPELRKLFEAGQSEGTFYTPTSWDNTAKIVSYRKIDKYPLFLNVGIATNDYLAQWKHDIIKIVILSTFYFVISLFLSWGLFARYKREKMTENDLFKLNLELEHRVSERTKELHIKNTELEVALVRVKQLEGIIPICMYCKKIRDDQNSWQQLEKYFTEHSEVMFSHGICPTCAEKQMEIIKNLKPPPA
jgi:hypothetical protein